MRRVQERNTREDIESIGKSNIERIAARIAAVNKVRFLIDVDGTLTSNPNYYLWETIPWGAIAEPQIQKEGQEKMIEIYVKTKLPFLKDAGTMFKEAGQKSEEVKIRRGVNNFFAGVNGPNSEYQIVSANFLPFIQGVLEQVPNAKQAGIKIWSVTERNAIALEKESIIRHVAQSNPDRAVIYIGDGSTDLPALMPKAAELVAGYFALKDSVFEKELKERSIPYLPYEDFDDVVRHLQYLVSLTKPRMPTRV